MKKITKNDKTLRAMALGLATTIAATSAPVTVLADEPADPGQTGVESSQLTPATQESGQDTESPRTVDEVSALAAGRGNAADAYTGNLKDEETTPVTEASGEVGTKAQAALDDVANAQAAVVAGNELFKTAKEVETYVTELSKDGTAGKPYKYSAQVTDAEKDEKKQEKAFGVKLDENGNVIKNGLEDKVSDANGKIEEADTKKETALGTLKIVENSIGYAKKEIANVTEPKKKADEDTTAANKAIAGAATLDTQTQEKLDGIRTDLENAVVEKDITKAVNDAQSASSDALQIAGDQFQIAEQALQQAANAANEAQQHSADYNRQQMIALASAAQNAADTAKQAATAADKAVETAKQKEADAAKAVEDAQTALKQAQDDAAAVLKAYKEELDRINGAIGTANDSRKDVRELMEKANKAIDNALVNMNGSDEYREKGVNWGEKAYQEMDEAIKAANKAIEAVTSLMYDENASKDEKKKNEFYKAERKCIDTNTKLQAQLVKLNEAKAAYDEVIKATGTVEANKQAADELVKEIDALINGADNLYDKWAKDADVDIKDLKALLATGSNYTYQQLVNTATETQGEVDRQGAALVEFVKKNPLFGEGDLTAEQIAEICKVEHDEDGKPIYTAAYKALVDASEEKTADIVEYKNGNETLDPKDADYTDADGNIYKINEGQNPTPSLIDDQQYKPGRYQNAWTKTTTEISKKVEGNLLQILTEVTYEQPVWTSEPLEVGKCDNAACTISREQYEKIQNKEMDEEEQKLIAIAFLCEDEKQLNLGEVKNIEVSANKVMVTVKDPQEDHTNAFLVYIFDCDIEIKFADAAWEQLLGIQLNFKINEFKEESCTRAGMFRETTGYTYTKYDRIVTPGEYTEDALALQETLGDLGAILTQYTTAQNYKSIADANLKAADDFDIKSAEDISDADKEKYQNALDAKQQILDAKTTAQGYLALITGEKGALAGLAQVEADAKDGMTAYDKANGLITEARNRLSAVSKNLATLKGLQQEAVQQLTGQGELVDNIAILTDVDTNVSTSVDVVELYQQLKKDIAKLAKYDLDEYNPLEYLHSEFMTLDVISVDSVSQKLAGAINTAAGALNAAEGNLKEIKVLRAAAEKKAEEVRGLAKLAQDEADKVARLLAAWRNPSEENEDSRSEDSRSADRGTVTGSETAVYGTVADLAAGTGLTSLIPVAGAGAGTGRTVARGGAAADTSGVLGVKSDSTDETKKEEEKKDQATGTDTQQNASAGETTTITDPELAGAATATAPGTGGGMIWAWALGLGAAAGIGTVGYANRKKRFADNNKK